INTNTSIRVARNNTTTKGKSNASTRTSNNVINLESSIEYKSDGLSLVISEVDYNSQEDGYFQDNDNNIKLAISHLVALAATDNKLFNKSRNENESNNKSVAEDEMISKMIEFQKKIKASNAVAEVVSSWLWFTRYVRNDFLTKTIGWLKDNLKETCEMMVLGSDYDGFWDIPKLLKQ
ncbi:921_t:CDS:2, partial [Cetraspora pellucida]